MTNNIAFAGAIAEVTDNGHFEFYDSKIFENYAYQTPIASILDSDLASVIRNCQIHSNFDLYDTWKNEIQNRCDKLCSVPIELRSYFKENNALLYSRIRSESSFNVISSSLKLQNATHIYNQNATMSIFLSDVEIVDCVVESIDMITLNFEIISSILNIRNSILHNISYRDKANLMLAYFDSLVTIDSLNFNDSISNLLKSRNSNVTISNLYLQNIEYEKEIIDISQSKYISINDVTVANVNVTNKVSIIGITNSINVQVSNFNAKNIDETVIKFIFSTVDTLDNFTIKNSSNALDFKQSTAKIITNSVFTSNGNLEGSQGGAIKIENSDITLINNTFKNNVANIGAAILFR